LNWNLPPKQQDSNVRLLAESDIEISDLILIGSKDTWDNCAKVIALKGYEKVKLYTPQLFEWLQDMNWPGAENIFNFLLANAAEASEYLPQVFQKAVKMKDSVWIYWLIVFIQKAKRTDIFANIDLHIAIKKCFITVCNGGTESDILRILQETQ
jgi:hypothetical protein